MSQKPNDGGPAFPRQLREWELEKQGTGMSLRQYYAGKAMAGLVVGCGGFLGDSFSAYAKGSCNGEIAKRAVVLADALIAELDKEGESDANN